VLEFGRNKKLVWLETGADGNHSVHRLASDVLAHALFFEVTSQPVDVEQRPGIGAAMKQLQDAMEVIVEFFTAAVYGYMLSCDAVRREREVVSPRVSADKETE
jgi:hypothetical protein